MLVGLAQGPHDDARVQRAAGDPAAVVGPRHAVHAGRVESPFLVVGQLEEEAS